jgi:Cyclin, N-terminal domain/Cyclin, C-terminal domain
MVSLCSVYRVFRHHYQLLGITSLWIASKYEENHGRIPSLKVLSYICCNSYEPKDFVHMFLTQVMMERVILNKLGFRLGAPTCESFLKIQSKLYLPPHAPQLLSLARYIMEQSLIHSRFVGHFPSMIAVASLMLAQRMLQIRPLMHPNPNINICISNLYDCLSQSPTQLVKKVYYHLTQFSAPVFGRVSQFFKTELQPPITPPKDSRWDRFQQSQQQEATFGYPPAQQCNPPPKFVAPPIAPLASTVYPRPSYPINIPARNVPEHHRVWHSDQLVRSVSYPSSDFGKL